MKISSDLMETLALYVNCFRRSYYLATSKKLETVEQIIDVIKQGVFHETSYRHHPTA